MKIELNIKKILSDALDSIKGSILAMGKKKIGEVLIDGVQAAVTENDKNASKLAAMAVDKLDATYKSGVISEQEYYKELGKIRDEYLTKGCEDWWEYTSKIGAYEQRILNENAAAVAKAYEEMTTGAIEDVDALITEADKAFTAIMKKKEDFSDKLAEYGEFYSKGKITIKNAGPGMQLVDGAWVNQQDIVFERIEFADFEKQVEVLENYRDDLVAIKERGDVPTEIFDVIRGLSVEEGLDVAEALLKMSDEDFGKYVNGYMEKKRLETEIANEIFNGEIESTKAYYNTMAEDLVEELSKSFKNIPENFAGSGIDSAKAFGEGFLQNIDGIIDAIKLEITNKLGEVTGKIFTEYGSSNVYNSSYNFYASQQTVSQQLEQARIVDVVNRLRG